MTIDNEQGTIVKDWGGKTPVAIVYPNTYFVGMSNLAVHLLYKHFNNDPEIVAERFFLPNEETKPYSLENKRQLADFNMACFTFSFEADYLNIPKIFGEDIPLRRLERDNTHPLFIAGGPSVTLNPEALSEIFDAIVVGEGDTLFSDISTIIKDTNNKDEALEKLAKINSIYIPKLENLDKIEKNTIQNLDKHPTYQSLWTNDTEFGRMHLVETGRGCPWNCKFCATPDLYSPHRQRSKESILTSIEAGVKHRQHIGLIGSDILGHPNFIEIANNLLDRGITFSLSSLRTNRITEEIAKILFRSGHKRIALGIEAGSEHLRKTLDKSLTENRIIQSVGLLAQAGITNLKLYFMIGLPEETEDDINSIGKLVEKIRTVILEKRKLKTMAPSITVVATPFVPKKMTPFKDKDFAGVKILNRKFKKLRSLIGKIPNSELAGDSPKRAHIEYVLSQADSNIVDIIEKSANTQNTYSLFKKL